MDETRSALIVACDEYTDPRLGRLRAPAVDARALSAVLQDPQIGGFEVRTLLNEPAHAVNLGVENFFADRRPGDLLLVHFSGHGVKDEDGELYFAATNTVLGRLAATAVGAEFVSKRMNRSRSRRVVLLLDCCYAGAFGRGLVARTGTDMGIEQQFSGRGRAVITASSAMEYAFEAGELADSREAPPSVFTSALVQGLETGEADRDQDGLVGLDELYYYVYDQVRAVTPNQTPGKWTFGMEGELYIARRSRPVATPAPLPPELQQAIGSPLPRVRAGAIQDLAVVLRGSHAGMALAARLALERLAEDDSRVVAAAATAALRMPAQVAPEGTVTADSDGGTATIHGHARVEPVPPPAPIAAAEPEPVPEVPKEAPSGAQQEAPSGAQQDAALAAASARVAPKTPSRRGVPRRFVLIAIGAVIAVAGPIIAISLIPGTPHGTGPTISGVRFTGTTAAATVMVTGNGFGSTPPTGQPDNITTCGNYGNNGEDYGPTNLRFADVGNFDAGRGTPPHGSCIGIIVLSWSTDQVTYTFGNAYNTSRVLRWQLSEGDQYTVWVKGVQYSGIVNFSS